MQLNVKQFRHFLVTDSSVLILRDILRRSEVLLSPVTIFSHCSHGDYYGSLNTQMVTFKLIKHKNRHNFGPKNVPHLNQRQLRDGDARKPAVGTSPFPLLCIVCRRSQLGAHLSVQIKWSSLSIKEPLRSTRLATGCHCYSIHTIASESFCQGLHVDGTWAPLHLTSPGIVIPSGGTHSTSQQHCSLQKRWSPLSQSSYGSVSKEEGKRKRREKKKRTSMVSHITGPSRGGL